MQLISVKVSTQFLTWSQRQRKLSSCMPFVRFVFTRLVSPYAQSPMVEWSWLVALRATSLSAASVSWTRQPSRNSRSRHDRTSWQRFHLTRKTSSCSAYRRAMIRTRLTLPRLMPARWLPLTQARQVQSWCSIRRRKMTMIQSWGEAEVRGPTHLISTRTMTWTSNEMGQESLKSENPNRGSHRCKSH